jgi:predicted RNA-binding protein with PUA domain
VFSQDIEAIRQMLNQACRVETDIVDDVLILYANK